MSGHSTTTTKIRDLLAAGFTEAEILRAGATVEDIKKAKEEEGSS